jgi:uncharacterized membrane protein YphA (DoxX/SURF4 family)
LCFGHRFYLEWLLVVHHLYQRKPFRMKKSFLTDIIAALFIFLFIYAAFSKLSDFQQFRVQLGQSPMLTLFAGTVAWCVPAIEILVSLLLFLDSTRLLGLFGSLGLMSMFSVYIFIITRYSKYVPCSCGGILQKMTWNQHLVFNIAFMLLALTGILLYNRPHNQIIHFADTKN